MSDSSERTIKASERRRREARQDGRSPQSAALVNGVQLLVVAALIYSLGEGLVISLAAFTKQSLANASVELKDPQDSLRKALDWSSNQLASWFAWILIVAIAVNVVQLGGLRLLVNRIMPDFNRVNPANGIGRLFAGQNVVAGMQSLAMVLIVLTSVALFWWSLLPKLVAMTALSEGTILIAIVRFSSSAALLVATILVLFGAIDFGFSWLKFERSLMMTPEEQRQELRDTQGSPQTKARRTEQARSIQ
jgi:flagellar biosynthetic protein FlhB